MRSTNTSNAGIRPTVLDRLLDDQPRKQEEADSQLTDLRSYRLTVARDLEALLNTRRSDTDEQISKFPEAATTLLNFGILDMNSLCLQNPDDREYLQNDIRVVIERFEPRLKRVRVSLDAIGSGERALCFRVAAVLAPHPSRPLVTFDATLQLASKTYEVKNKD